VKLSESTAEEIQACELLLQDHFDKMATDADSDTFHLEFENVSLNASALDDAGDLGVSAFKKLSRENLNNLLQMPDGRPPFFNDKLAHDRTVTPWDFANGQLPKEQLSEECTLLWHQQGGLGALAVRAWTDKPSPKPIPGTMLADGVGVGKTLQMLAHIAFTMCVRAGEILGGVRPPLIGEWPYTYFSDENWALG
jgi:hypothetical protein